MKFLVANVLVAGLVLGVTARNVFHPPQIETKDIKPLDRERMLVKEPVSQAAVFRPAVMPVVPHHGKGGLQCPNKKQGPQQVATAETWLVFLKKYAEKITSFTSTQNWSAFAQWLVSISKQQDFPVKPCAHGGHRVIAIRLVGIDQKDLHGAVKLNANSQTGGDGWWALLVRRALRGQPKEKQDEAVKKVIEIVIKFQDVIRKNLKNRNWKVIIELLQKQSKEQGLNIDWTTVLGEKSPNGKSFRRIIEHWATLKPEQSKRLPPG